MPQVLSVRQATGMVSEAGEARRSDRMLSELLTLNEEMVVQLRLERLSVVGTTDFLTDMIGQHEQIVARLRAQLKRHQAGSPGAGPLHAD